MSEHPSAAAERIAAWVAKYEEFMPNERLPCSFIDTPLLLSDIKSMIVNDQHEHVWQDTGFADVEDCEVCGITRYDAESHDYVPHDVAGWRWSKCERCGLPESAHKDVRQLRS